LGLGGPRSIALCPVMGRVRPGHRGEYHRCDEARGGDKLLPGGGEKKEKGKNGQGRGESWERQAWPYRAYSL
jgi:hypothetical protein